MATYNVISAGDGWRVQGFPTGRTACTVETKATMDRAEAQRWADQMNDGKDPPEAKVCMYADD